MQIPTESDSGVWLRNLHPGDSIAHGSFKVTEKDAEITFISYVSILHCSLPGKSKESKAEKKSELIPKEKKPGVKKQSELIPKEKKTWSQKEKDTEGKESGNSSRAEWA